MEFIIFSFGLVEQDDSLVNSKSQKLVFEINLNFKSKINSFALKRH